jgi:NADPH2:quinone reductase
MKAVLSLAAGSPEAVVLRDVPEPQPKSDEILVRVASCGVNYPDVLLVQDLYQLRPERPFSPGGEIAGVVVDVGHDVTTHAVGDRVMCRLNFGGMAELIAVPASRCVHIPAGMPYAEAAAIQTAYLTSYHALKQRARMQRGETLLVLGAAGGVGLAAVQLGAAMGARVVAAASSAEKLEHALRSGAQQGVVYPTGSMDKDGQRALSRLLKDATGPDGPDVVFDAVGGDYSEPALRTIALYGRFLVVGFPAGIARLPLNLPLLKTCQIVGVLYGPWEEREPDQARANSAEVLDLYSRGLVKPQVSAVYEMEAAGEALAHLAARRVIGKVVVSMGAVI